MLKPFLSRAVVVVAALLLALCAGAVWSVLALMLGDPAQWMALPAGAVAVWAVDWVAPRHAWVRALLATLAVLLVGELATAPFDLAMRSNALEYGLTRQSLGGWLRDQGTSLLDRKSTRLNSSHSVTARMPSSA